MFQHVTFLTLTGDIGSCIQNEGSRSTCLLCTNEKTGKPGQRKTSIKAHLNHLHMSPHYRIKYGGKITQVTAYREVRNYTGHRVTGRQDLHRSPRYREVRIHTGHHLTGR